MGRCAATAIFVAACGRIGFGPTGAGEGDGGPADGALVIVPDVPAGCAFGPWQAPVFVTELDGPFDEGDPGVRADDLEIVFARSAAIGGPGDLFHARRNSPGEPWGTAVALAALNTSGIEGGPAFARDGLTLYYASDQGGYTLWRATRAALSDPFANPQPLPGGPFVEAVDPTLTADGLELFHSTTFGDLHVATRASTASAFGAPMLLPAPVASTSWQEGPSISADGTTLYFTQETTPGIYEAFVSARPDRMSAFAAPTNVAELAIGQPEWDPELAADGTTMYFSRFNAGVRGIWKTQRTCL